MQQGDQGLDTSGFADHEAVIGADLFNEPWWSYVGGSPPPGQTVAQAAGSRLHAFYTDLAPSVTANSPGWLLFFQDTGGGYNSADPSRRESPWLTGKPAAPLLQHALNVRHVAFSADGRRLLTACWDKAARLWDVSPTDWPVEDIVAAASVASAARVGADRILQPLNGAQIALQWENLRGKYLGLFGEVGTNSLGR